MRRYLPLLALTVLCAGTTLWVFLQGGFAAWFALAFLWGAWLNSVSVLLFSMLKMDVARRVSRGVLLARDGLSVELDVRHVSFTPVIWVAVTERWDRQRGEERFAYRTLIFPWFRSRFVCRYRIEGLPRGIYRFRETEIVTGDLFGIALKRRVIAATGSFTVLPRPTYAAGGSLSSREGTDSTLPLQAGVGQELSGTVREYVSGDPLQRVHWKSSAKQGRLMTREEEPSEAGRLLVCLDGTREHYGGSGGAALFEAAVQAAWGLLQQAAARRQEAGVAIHGLKPVMAAPLSRIDMAYCSRLLAEAHPDGCEEGSGGYASWLLQTEHAAPPGIALVCVTPVLNEALVSAVGELRARRRSVQIVCVSSLEMPASVISHWKQRFGLLGCGLSIASISPKEKEVQPYAEDAGA